MHQITAASRPLTRGLPPSDPRSLCPLSSTEFVETPPPPNKIPGYATDSYGKINDLQPRTFSFMSILDSFITGLPPPAYLNSSYYRQQVKQDISHLRFIQLHGCWPFPSFPWSNYVSSVSLILLMYLFINDFFR